MTNKARKFNKINVEISNVCNLQCSFCPEVKRTKTKMNLELFRRVIEQIAPLTEQVCLHLMGEPLTHPELQSFIQICAVHNLPVFFVSNGVLLQDKHTDILLHPVIRQLNFSLHSFHDNFPNKDPGPYLEKIFKLTELAFNKRPDLYINFRLWNLQSTAILDQHEIRQEIHQSPSVMTTPTDNKELTNLDFLRRIENHFSIPLFEKLQKTNNIKQQKSLHILNRLYLHFDTEFIWPDLNLPILGKKGTCYGLSSHFGILADGTVVPCCLDKEASIPLGNIQQKNITEILNSPRAQNILLGFKQNKLHEDLCQRCQYIERFQ